MIHLVNDMILPVALGIGLGAATTAYLLRLYSTKKQQEISFPQKAEVTQSLYTQLYQKSPVPYFVVNMDGDISSANTAAARLLGREQYMLRGQNIFSLLNVSSPEHKNVLVEKFRGGIGISDELVWLQRPDRKQVWTLMSLCTFDTAYTESYGLLTLVDITKQKKAEDAKTEFISLASHQLRTPIAGMKWSAELLEMDGSETLSPRQHKYLNRLTDSISRLSVLVDDFLRVSRFELGTFEPELQPFPIKELVSDVLQEQADTIAHKQITLETSFDKRVTEVTTDPDLLRMIVTNIFGNAVKYTSVGGFVDISYELKDRLLTLRIRDTGMGIPASEQPQIFSKLFRASNAAHDVPDGTGLGLYIVREAVEVLGGKIDFVSAEGQGSTFTVQIPVTV